MGWLGSFLLPISGVHRIAIRSSTAEDKRVLLRGSTPPAAVRCAITAPKAHLPRRQNLDRNSRLAVTWIPSKNGRRTLIRPGERGLLLLSLGILAFLLLMTYVFSKLYWNRTGNRGPLTSDCTLYASPLGNNGNSGTSPSSPKSFSGAASATVPGSVVCLLGGTYQLNSSFKPPNSGSPLSWIVYKSYGDGPVNFLWNGPTDASSMFDMHGGAFPSKPAYLEFRGLNLDGRGSAADGFFCRGSHHLRFIGNSISNTGGSGIASIDCDYLTVDHNLIHHNGYLPSETAVPSDYGWTSGISLNSTRWFDAYPGFHNVVSGNVVAGEYDGSSHHSDGNGIILDLSNGTYDYHSANTPPALIVNNVVYGNGGRCIVAYVVANFWIVNNTCYKNNLDPELQNAGSLASSDSVDGYFINNIAVVWNSSHLPFEQRNSNSNISYYSNMYFGGSNNFLPADSSQLILADPLFLRPPMIDPALPGAYAVVPHPSLLGNALTLSPSSPAIGSGIDPATLPKLPSPLVEDLKKSIYSDIKGDRRRPGGPFDLGAYQSHQMP